MADTTVIHGINPATGDKIEPGYPAAGAGEIDSACAAAAEAFAVFRNSSLEERAAFLEAVADKVGALGDTVIETAHAETGLPIARLTGELGRTTGQLRLFANVVRSGEWLGLRHDPAMPGRTPLPRSDLRMRMVPLGPVALFGASNFPLAFSVGGGDTASALAAGCPVVVKGHPAHPGTSALVAGAIAEAVAACGLPKGVFAMVMSADNDVAASLVSDPRIAAVGFTGSRGGGLAIARIAASRAVPIPVYAEMSSINPVLVFPAAMESRGPAIAKAYVSSLALGVGQFCTNPGLTLVIEGPGADAFESAVGEALADAAAAPMLTPAICKAHDTARGTLSGTAGVKSLGQGPQGEGPCDAYVSAYSARAEDFLGSDTLQAEVFGPTGLIVRCADVAQMGRVLEALEGQLTIALHMDEADHALAAPLVPVMEDTAGRILVNGFGTGVEVCHAMVHGGPYPATTDGRTTSVGSLAIDRFLRPVCYQDFPAALLPAELKDEALASLPALIDGKRN